MLCKRWSGCLTILRQQSRLFLVSRDTRRFKESLQVRALDLPALPGLVVDPSQVTSVQLVTSEARKLHPSRFLIRHDRRPESGHYPQGGYIIPLEKLEEELNWYRSQGRLVILLYPADPLDNMYSASCGNYR